MRRALILLTAGLTLAAAGCNNDDPVEPDDGALFEVRVEDETFTVRAEDDAVIAALEARLESGEEGVILGELGSGDGGFNEPWSWHTVAGTIETPDVATEVCDGRPSFVEDNLEYWLDTVGRYCPFGATVVARVD